jgi:hypothetical protein
VRTFSGIIAPIIPCQNEETTMHLQSGFSARPARITPRFGQLFIGSGGKEIVLEPKKPDGKGALLYQAVPDGPIQMVGASPVVEAWTKVIENYGPMFSPSSPGFIALTNFIKLSLWSAGVLNAIPKPDDRQNATRTLLQGSSMPFNHGLKLDYPA